MSTLMTSELRPAADLCGASDLMIHEFDSWTNSREPVFSPTTMCWCRLDFTSEATE